MPIVCGHTGDDNLRIEVIIQCAVRWICQLLIFLGFARLASSIKDRVGVFGIGERLRLGLFISFRDKQWDRGIHFSFIDGSAHESGHIMDTVE